MSTTSKLGDGWILAVAMGVALVVTAPVWAAKGGKGGGGGGTGGELTPVKITFADDYGALGNRISGDGLGPYVHDPDGSGDGVQAYLGGGGARGDLFLRLANAPGRGLWLDFGDCHPDASSCNPTPDSRYVDLVSSLAVAPGDIGYADGLLGMAAGDEIDVPMDMYYDFDDPAGPGFIYFDSGLKGRNPCTNRSLYVTVSRPTAAPLWVVSASEATLACVRLPGGALSGQYLMPFSLTVELAAP